MRNGASAWQHQRIMARRKSAGGGGEAMAAAGAQHARRHAGGWRHHGASSWRRHGYNGEAGWRSRSACVAAAYRRCVAIINGAAVMANGASAAGGRKQHHVAAGVAITARASANGALGVTSKMSACSAGYRQRRIGWRSRRQRNVSRNGGVMALGIMALSAAQYLWRSALTAGVSAGAASSVTSRNGARSR
jgi:hypothetical protein